MSLRQATAIAALLLLSVARASAEDVCPKKDGLLPGPAVPTAAVAKQIYIAVAKGLYPETWRKYPKIFVTDEGTHWGVGQAPPVPPVKTSRNAKGETIETVLVVTGGGALQMEIDKCDGAVAMSFSR